MLEAKSPLDKTAMVFKECKTCRIEYEATKKNFYKDTSTPDGLRNDCKGCKRARTQSNRASYRRIWETEGANPFTGLPKRCPDCHQDKPKTNEFWYSNSNHKDGLQTICKQCGVERYITYSAHNHVKGLLRAAKASSKKRGHEAPTINEDWFEAQWQAQSGRCYWSHQRMLNQNNSGGGGQGLPMQVTLERLDCSRGYHPDNVVLSTWVMNRARGNMPADEFRRYLRALGEQLREVNKNE